MYKSQVECYATPLQWLCAVAGYWQELEHTVIHVDTEHPKHAQLVTCLVRMQAGHGRTGTFSASRNCVLREISFLCVWNISGIFYFSLWNMGPTLYMLHLYFCSVNIFTICLPCAVDKNSLYCNAFDLSIDLSLFAFVSQLFRGSLLCFSTACMYWCCLCHLWPEEVDHLCICIISIVTLRSRNHTGFKFNVLIQLLNNWELLII